MEASKWASAPAEDPPVSILIALHSTRTDTIKKSTFTLNPAAAEYSFTPSLTPTPQQTFTPQSYPEEDEFASQTRAQDDLDLFDDDFEPIPEPTPQQSIPSAPRADRGVGRGGRGRGRGRGGLQESAHAARPTTYTDVRLEASNTEEASPDDNNNDNNTTVPADVTPPTTEEPTRPRVEAVRGDRSKTGGLKKAKLTEAELSERMAVMKLKNATRTADYERAAADEASFREREVQAQVKRAEEFRNRQQMDKEREKNAQRKLKAMGGREWDTEKTLEEERDSRRSQFRRGAYGGVASASRTPAETAGEGNAGAVEEWTGSVPPPLEGDSSAPPDLFASQYRERDGGRGRGGRGRFGYEGRGGSYEGRGGGGRGRGRGSGHEGNRGGGSSSNNSNRFNVTTEDFPALGAAAAASTQNTAWGATTSTSIPSQAKTTEVPAAAKPEWDKPSIRGDWADEMAQPDPDSTTKW